MIKEENEQAKIISYLEKVLNISLNENLDDQYKPIRWEDSSLVENITIMLSKISEEKFIDLATWELQQCGYIDHDIYPMSKLQEILNKNFKYLSDNPLELERIENYDKTFGFFNENDKYFSLLYDGGNCKLISYNNFNYHYTKLIEAFKFGNHNYEELSSTLYPFANECIKNVKELGIEELDTMIETSISSMFNTFKEYNELLICCQLLINNIKLELDLNDNLENVFIEDGNDILYLNVNNIRQLIIDKKEYGKKFTSIESALEKLCNLRIIIKYNDVKSLSSTISNEDIENVLNELDFFEVLKNNDNNLVYKDALCKLANNEYNHYLSKLNEKYNNINKINKKDTKKLYSYQRLLDLFNDIYDEEDAKALIKKNTLKPLSFLYNQFNNYDDKSLIELKKITDDIIKKAETYKRIKKNNIKER